MLLATTMRYSINVVLALICARRGIVLLSSFVCFLGCGVVVVVGCFFLGGGGVGCVCMCAEGRKEGRKEGRSG